MFRRVFRLTVKLSIIAAVGIGIAVVVKKLTAAPADSSGSLEPWPPLKTDASKGDESSNGDSAPASETTEEAASNS